MFPLLLVIINLPSFTMMYGYVRMTFPFIKHRTAPWVSPHAQLQIPVLGQELHCSLETFHQLRHCRAARLPGRGCSSSYFYGYNHGLEPYDYG